MRPLEFALFLSCLPAVFTGIFAIRPARPAELALLLVPLVALVICGVVEGLRVQLVPLYLAAVLLGLAAIVVGYEASAAIIRAGAAMVFLLALCGLVAGWCFPVFEFPPLPGPYRVGSSSLEIKTSDGKNVLLQAWYPASAYATGARMKYGVQASSRRLSNLQFVRTHALEGVEVGKAEAGWPVVFYSPSWAGSRFENTALCEALASEGFVVMAMDHPDRGELPGLDFTTEASFERFMKAAERELNSRARDVLQVFAALTDLQSGALAGGKFQGRLNLAAAGVAGYSFGGAVAAEACLRDPRLRAGANLDGTLFGKAERTGAPQPFLFVTDTAGMPPESELRSPDGAVRRNAEFFTKSLQDMDRWLQTRGGWLVRFDGTQHASFSDQPLYSRFHTTGTQDARHKIEEISASVVAFFDVTLRGESSGRLLDQNAPSNGVEVRFFPPP